MDRAFWIDRWEQHQTAFHQPHIHDQLKRFWPMLGLAAGDPVFVPLCGKSRDMVWLADRGHSVIGVELSPVAVREFFDERRLTPTVSQHGPLQVSSAGPFTLYGGDIFDLGAADLKTVAGVYDRAALVALSQPLRSRYAETLKHLLPKSASILLIGLDYPPSEIEGPPFAVLSGEVSQLFGNIFDIEVLEKRDGLAASENLRNRGVTRLDETAYLLRRRS